MFWMMKKSIKRSIAISVIASLLLFLLPSALVFADVPHEEEDIVEDIDTEEESESLVGKTIITIGDGLNASQRTQILDEMAARGASEDAEIINVTIDEEIRYLGDYISRDKIGNSTNSNAMITIKDEGAGIIVNTNNVTYISEEMYANALLTAGITDADVYVTAAFPVSGTGALTGIIKAFEEITDTEISEEQKQVANEEIVRTAELGEKIGAEEAAELMKRLKEALDNTNLETDQDYRDLIQRVADELNVSLTDEDIEALIHLLKRLKNLNINWSEVGDQLRNIRDNLDDILNSEETRNFIRRVLDVIVGLIDRLKELFSS